jgi:hypothetical protein
MNAALVQHNRALALIPIISSNSAEAKDFSKPYEYFIFFATSQCRRAQRDQTKNLPKTRQRLAAPEFYFAMQFSQ